MMKKQWLLIIGILIVILLAGFRINPVTSDKQDLNDLVYSTFFGGTDIDIGTAIVQDSQGNIIIAGLTYSTDFPVTSGAYDETPNGGADVFVSKFSPDGTSLIFSTYIGGSEDEIHHFSKDKWSSQIGLAIDSADNIIVHGPTHSLDFPVTPEAYNKTYSGTGDMFVLKLAANGSDLLFSTYLGGSSFEENAQNIALDNVDNIYLSGLTSSLDFPTTPDALNTTHNGGCDIFVTKLAADGTSLLYSTFFGGSFEEFGVFIKLDNENNMYIGGTTYSSDLPTTSNAFDPNKVGGEGFIAKISADGSELLYSTYIGGSAGDSVYDMVVDVAGTMYVAGITTSSDFEVTSNAYDKTYNGSDQYGSDAFFMKITSSGSLIYSTFLGGTGMECFFKILLDSNNDVFLFGVSMSNSCYPTTSNAYDPECDDEYNQDYVITKMVNNGSYLLYSTYLGGSGDEPGVWQGRPHYNYPDFLLADENSVVIGGITTSTDYPVTNNALIKTLNGQFDVCISQLNFTDQLPQISSTTTTTTEGISPSDSTSSEETSNTTPEKIHFPSFIYLLSIIGVIITLHRRQKQ
jgi:hypothetical protein